MDPALQLPPNWIMLGRGRNDARRTSRIAAGLFPIVVDMRRAGGRSCVIVGGEFVGKLSFFGMIRSSLLFLSVLFGAAAAVSLALPCTPPPLHVRAEKFRLDLWAVNSVDEIMSTLPAVAFEPARDMRTVEAVDGFVRERFVHGYSEYRPCDDWLAWAAGSVWDDLRNPVLPDHILQYRQAACSQQAIVLQAVLGRLGFEYASVGFPAMMGPGSGHFATTVKVDGRWYFVDPNFENDAGRHVLLQEVLSGEVLPSIFAGELGVRWREAAHQGRIEVKSMNRFPAPQASIFHRITGFMSWYGWLVFAFAYLLSLSFDRLPLRRRGPCQSWIPRPCLQQG